MTHLGREIGLDFAQTDVTDPGRYMPNSSPEKKGIDDYERDNHANGAPDQHVTNIVPGHALSRFRCGLGDLFAMPFRHQTLVFLNEMDVAPLGACSGATSSQRDCSKTV